MKFKKYDSLMFQGETYYKIKINNEWLILCYCVNCKEVHAYHKSWNLFTVDKKIHCCENPNNHIYDNYDNYDNSLIKNNGLIKKFVKKWRD